MISLLACVCVACLSVAGWIAQRQCREPGVIGKVRCRRHSKRSLHGIDRIIHKLFDGIDPCLARAWH